MAAFCPDDVLPGSSLPDSAAPVSASMSEYCPPTFGPLLHPQRCRALDRARMGWSVGNGTHPVMPRMGCGAMAPRAVLEAEVDAKGLVEFGDQRWRQSADLFAYPFDCDRAVRHRTGTRPQKENTPNQMKVRGDLDVLRHHTGRPRQDSNLRTRLRRAVLYPLSYGGSRTEQEYQHPASHGPPWAQLGDALGMLSRERAGTR
jgi:hypothetical protein